MGAERDVLFANIDHDVTCGKFTDDLSPVSGVIVFGNATLGQEKGAPVQLYENIGKSIPHCFEFLGQEKRLGELIGFD